jgi:hypothetical protein
MTSAGRPAYPQHPRFSRRHLLEAGSIGLLGLGMNHVEALRAMAGTSAAPKADACIFIFLSGGLAQHESFDLKPEAPDGVRGEFKPIATTTPGIEISEHLPLLAQRSRHWALLRSLSHGSNDHSASHHIMLTGRSTLPVGFDPNRPKAVDYPAMVCVAGHNAARRNTNLPPAVVLPETLIHWSGRTIPGQYGGHMGHRRDPWFIEASPYHPVQRGAYPGYSFANAGLAFKPEYRVFQAPNLTLADGMTMDRFHSRLAVLGEIDRQRRDWDRFAQVEQFDRFRQGAISLLADQKVRSAFDVTHAPDAEQDRYGRNSFGWSLLMARRLVEAGVTMVQVNLGNDETWDQHGDIFPRLRDNLFPPTDRALSALLDDLAERGRLERTLIVMASEFGRTPRLKLLQGIYNRAGRDHWGAVQSVFFAGGGVRGGTVVGSSDRIGSQPASDPQKPENLAATIYHALGIPETTMWHDDLERPHHVYFGQPIRGLLA